MDSQITLMGFEPPDYKESVFLESVIQSFKDAVNAKGSDRELVTYKATQLDSGSSGYTAVFFHNFTVFRLKLRGKQHHISVPLMFYKLIPDDYPTQQMKSDPKYIRIIVDSKHPVESYSEFLTMLVGESVDRYPHEWGCCSRYEACSDAKTCTHPDKTFALGCAYRKALNSGRIFYGKNRNIN